MVGGYSNVSLTLPNISVTGIHSLFSKLTMRDCLASLIWDSTQVCLAFWFPGRLCQVVSLTYLHKTYMEFSEVSLVTQFSVSNSTVTFCKIPVTVKVARNYSCTYSFIIKIKVLVSAKALPTVFLKESAFTKHLLIYLLQQTKVFNFWLCTV